MRSKLYTPAQVLLVAALATAVGGCWLLAQNFRRLGAPKLAWAVLIVGLVVTAGVLGLAMFGLLRPGMNAGSVLPAAACFWYARAVQGPMVAAHVASGGRRESWWKALGVGVAAGLAVLAAVVAAVALGAPVPE